MSVKRARRNRATALPARRNVRNRKHYGSGGQGREGKGGRERREGKTVFSVTICLSACDSICLPDGTTYVGSVVAHKAYTALVTAMQGMP